MVSFSSLKVEGPGLQKVEMVRLARLSEVGQPLIGKRYFTGLTLRRKVICLTSFGLPENYNLYVLKLSRIFKATRR